LGLRESGALSARGGPAVKHRGDCGCAGGGFARHWGMGAKYLPTVKDQKASQRFHQKQNPLPKTKKQGPRSGKKGR